MTLHGPELDLLLEVLEEDPTADVFLSVARTLIDGGRPAEGAQVLRRAIEHGAEDADAARLLALTATELGDDASVRLAASRLGEDAMRGEPVLARAWALALDRAGDLTRAGELARVLLERGPDAELQAILEREQAPPPANHVRARDPRYTVNLAEAYLENGRPDLAIRTYRRILAAQPTDASVHARLLRLHALPRGDRPWVDDVSEEYWVRRAPPPLLMPTPSLVPSGEPDTDTTQPGAPLREVLADGNVVPRKADDEDTSILARRPASPTPAAVPPSPPVTSRPVPAVNPVATPDVATLRPAEGRSGRPQPGVSLRNQAGPAIPAPDDDEETTVLPRMDLASLAADPPSDNDTVLLPRVDMGSSTGAPGRRVLPGTDALRKALAEERPSGEDDDDVFDEEGDPDDIIEQARAIERAADKRRRSLLRK